MLWFLRFSFISNWNTSIYLISEVYIHWIPFTSKLTKRTKYIVFGYKFYLHRMLWFLRFSIISNWNTSICLISKVYLHWIPFTSKLTWWIKSIIVVGSNFYLHRILVTTKVIYYIQLKYLYLPSLQSQSTLDSFDFNASFIIPIWVPFH